MSLDLKQPNRIKNLSSKKFKVLRASGQTEVLSLAKSIVIEVKKKGKVEIQYIGEKAGNVATKAIAVARNEVLNNGVDLWSYPMFRNLNPAEVQPDGEKRITGISLVIEDKSIN